MSCFEHDTRARHNVVYDYTSLVLVELMVALRSQYCNIRSLNAASDLKLHKRARSAQGGRLAAPHLYPYGLYYLSTFKFNVMPCPPSPSLFLALRGHARARDGGLKQPCTPVKRTAKFRSCELDNTA